MFNAISHTFINVLDQDQALEYYVGTLGFEVRNDVDLGFMRWLTVNVPGDPDHELVLAMPGGPMVDDATSEKVGELLTKGALPGFILRTADCHATYEELKARGAEFIQEPMEHFYGIDCAIRDPFGNHIRVTQPAPEPLQIPEPTSAA